MRSPYVISGPVRGPQFYGRRALLAEIAGGHHRAMYVIGGRQMGKTSLLRQVKEMRPALDLNVQFAAGNLKEFPGHLLHSLKRQQARMEWLPDAAALADGDFFQILQAVADAAEDSQELIYLLVDESDGLISESNLSLDFLHRLRGLFQMCDSLRLLLVASRRLSKARDLFRAADMSPLLDGFAAFFLTPFSDDEAAELLERTNTGSPLQTPLALRREIIHLSGGHPHFLQLLGYHLYQDNQWGPISQDILSQIDHIAAGLFANDFATLTDTERQILKLVSRHHQLSFAELQSGISTARLPILLKGLAAHGYLKRRESGYRTGSVFLDRWLERLSPAEWAEPSPVPEGRAFDLVSRQEQIEEIQKLLLIHHKNLSQYHEIKAQYGFDCPLHVLNGISHEEEQIEELEVELERLRGS